MCPASPRAPSEHACIACSGGPRSSGSGEPEIDGLFGVAIARSADE